MSTLSSYVENDVKEVAAAALGHIEAVWTLVSFLAPYGVVRTPYARTDHAVSCVGPDQGQLQGTKS